RPQLHRIIADLRLFLLRDTVMQAVQRGTNIWRKPPPARLAAERRQRDMAVARRPPRARYMHVTESADRHAGLIAAVRLRQRGIRPDPDKSHRQIRPDEAMPHTIRADKRLHKIDAPRFGFRYWHIEQLLLAILLAFSHIVEEGVTGSYGD